MCGADGAGAATLWWTDAVGDHLWSTPGNWSNGSLNPTGAPVSGDYLILGDPDFDNGRNSGTTTNDIPNLLINGLRFGEDTDHFTVGSSVGGVVIDGALELDHASADVGLVVYCPVTIINGGFIANNNDNGSTEVDFNNTVNFASAGTITAYASLGTFTANVNTIAFKDTLSSAGDLEIDADYTGPMGTYFGAAEGYVALADLAVSGNLIANAEGNGSTIVFYGTRTNHISGVLHLASGGGGLFQFFTPGNEIVAASTVVRDGSTVNVALNGSGVMGPGSTVTIPRGAELDLSGSGEPLMGTLVLENAAGDTRSSIFNAGNTTPEFGAGPILVTGDNDQVNPIIKGNIILDGTPIERTRRREECFGH